MAKRLAPTLADYAVIAISPALIMTLVGSLVFFLIEVFYLGEYDGRLTFIMAMFVMGAVSIARLAIEEGRDYAILFAVPLGIVTAIATFRFVEYSGPLQAFSPAINIGLIALIWWCANKLTWDSTVIDEGKDASGEGLLQTVGLDSNESSNDLSASVQDGTTTRGTPQPQLTLWQKFVQRRHRPHAPGVWVVYFSLAALPIFGFGNWFIPSSDADSRRYAFKLLVVYVASALGLLLTTSFLGLRRYLRQRRLEMPTEIATGWLGTGAVMIVGLLVLCLILPRRNAEYSITQLPVFAGSPTDLWTTEYAVGNEGQEDPEKADREGAQSGGENQSNPSDGKKASEQQSSSSSSQGKSEGDQNQSSQSGDQQQEGKQGSGNQESDQSGGGKSEGKQGGQQQSGDKQDGQTGQSQNSSDQSQPTDSSQGKQSKGDKAKGKKGDLANAENRDSRKNEQQNAESQQAEQRPANDTKQQKAESRSNNARQKSPSTPRSTSKFDPSKIGSAIGGSIGQLLKLIYWLIVIAIVAYVLWRYHREIMEAVRNFMNSLRDFWDSLFGRKRAFADEQAAAAETPAGPPPKPFSSFPDPFLTGMAQQQPPAEVIRYSFEAFEAWGRERGCPREPEQTPHEYAQSVGQQQTTIGREVSALAELYCRCAYGNDPGNRANFEHLRRLWEKLRAV